MLSGLAATGGGLNQSQASILGLVVSLLVLAWVLYRQRQVRPLRTTLILPVVLIILGVLDIGGAGKSGLGSPTGLLILVALLIGDAVGLGALRALTVHIWQSGDTAFRQGSWWTIGLWLVGTAIHLAVDALAGISESTVLLYLGVTLIAQRLVLQLRARDMGSLQQMSPGRASGDR
jgi:hypothetical protein